jgi:hypothetical protein
MTGTERRRQLLRLQGSSREGGEGRIVVGLQSLLLLLRVLQWMGKHRGHIRGLAR